MKVCYRDEAKEWLEALPIGNGRLGAMIYGGATVEHIELNESTLWSGYPVQEYQSLTYETYLNAKEYVKQGKNREAMLTLENELLKAEDVQMYLPFASLRLEFLGDRNITDYKRALDLEKGVLSVSYKNNGNLYEHMAFASYLGKCVIYRIKAEEEFKIRISMTSKLLSDTRYEKGKIILSGQCPGRSGFTVGGSKKRHASHQYSSKDEEKGMRFEGRVRLQTDAENVEITSEGITYDKIKCITLYMMMRTSFNGYQKHPFLEGKNEKEALDLDEKRIAKEDSYDSLRQEHIEDYKELFDRVHFSVGDIESQELYPLDEFMNFKAGRQSISFYKVLFDYGRYLLISSSRPGTQAATLQGIWNKELIPPWFCNYTLNINTQMNYWMTGPCNLPELQEPLVTLCRELAETGKQTANEIYHCRGSLAFHNADIWRKSTPANGRAMWSYWPFGLAWLCANLFDQYLFTMDKDYLKEIFPVLQENVLFLLDMLEETSEGYTILMGTSPENEYISDGEKVTVSMYTENNNAIVRGSFKDYLQACEILGVKNELKDKLAQIIPHIIQTKIGSDGQILEWDREYEEVDVHHRHLSNLYAFHPGREWTRDSEQYFQAVFETLKRRGDAGTGWSLAWKISMWARMENGKKVGEIMKNFFHLVSPEEEPSCTKGGLYPNLFCAHPPFQIDGNLGYAAGVAEMLLQSHGREIVLLPAILPEWRTGRVDGLVARGGIRVAMNWNNGELTFVELQGEPGTEIRLRYCSRVWEVQLNQDGIYRSRNYA